MTPDPLAPLDLAFWNIESAEHPMHLGALGVFEADSPTAGALAADLLAARAPAVPGLRMRIRDTWQPPMALRRPFAFGGATREPDPRFDPLDHVRLHAPATDFHARAGRLMERPWNADGPRGRRTCCRARTAGPSPCCSSSTTPWPTVCAP